ncbi:multiple inositol polyphosphate phosphatase 1-like [Pygocentrus nattereri]|uniref:Multiple inositol polyphosphate phosphatase 1 n=1 Tax=Pygocentrus nattereri TaxID=42514 RepID=A0A3B4DWR6_PYGNA|nr:multiple inositol polyphosphate phosphatase 1-like [Pygocentrus nattereri]
MVGKVLPAVFLSAAFHVSIVYLAVLSSYCATATPRDAGIPALARYFNTKGRYEEANPYLLDDILAINSSAAKPPSPTCTPVHLTAIIRHGTRFPTAPNIRKLYKFHSLVKTEADGDFSFLPQLKAWKMWYKEEMDGRLVAKGRADHRHLAQRLVKTFPSLLTKENLLGLRVKFTTSSKHRCVNSTLAFQQGLKEHFSIEGEHLNFTLNDALMRFFDTCARLVETVEKNKKAVEEVTRFNRGPEMKRVQEKLADRLQIPYANVTMDGVEAAFYLCAYEFTILGVNSPWCQLFDEADAQVVEYSGDLKQYWKKGFGHDINSKSSCVLFHDLFNRLSAVASQVRSDQPVSEVVTVQIGHAETLLPLLTLLGLFKDNTSLTSINFPSQLGRAFRCGQIMPYTANLLVALYDCPDGVRLQVRVNEKPVTLPGLAGPSPLYEDVKKQYHQLLTGCDQDTVCQLNNLQGQN